MPKHATSIPNAVQRFKKSIRLSVIFFTALIFIRTVIGFPSLPLY